MKKIPFFPSTSKEEAVVNSSNIIHDRWIIGEGTDSEYEYLIHLAQPRFVAKIDVDDSPEALAAEHWELEGGELLFDFVWLDAAITDSDVIKALCTSASHAFDRNAKKLGY